VAGSHKCAQIYTIPVDEATNRRVEMMATLQRTPLRRDWLASLHSMLLSHNALVRSFVSACQDCHDWSINVGTMEPHATASNDTMVGLLMNGGSDRVATVIPQHGDGSLVIVPDLL